MYCSIVLFFIKSIILILFVFQYASLFAQQTLWQNCLGGSGFDNAAAYKNTPDGAFIIAGTTRSFDGDLEGKKNKPDADAWVIKVNAKGKIAWSITAGGSFTEEIKDVEVTKDRGYIVCGFTESKELSAGKRDMFVFRLDALGKFLWQKTYGGTGNESANVVLVLPDSGYFFGGETGSIDGASPSKGGLDFWVVRTDKNGNKLWEKNYGGTGNDVLTAAAATADGGFILAGASDSQDGDAAGNKGKTDVLVIKIDAVGNIQWKKTLGGSSFDEVHEIVAAGDNRNFLLAGTTFSTDEDIKNSNGGGDAWIVKFSANNGIILWSKTYGGTGDEGANGISVTYGGGYLIAGTSRSKDGLLKENKGVYDGWVFKTDTSGKVLWSKSMGGYQSEAFLSAYELPSGDYLAVGYTASKDGDLANIFTKGGNDFWIVSLRDPIRPPQAISLTPTIIAGYVTDKNTGLPIKSAVVQYVDNERNKVLKTENCTVEGIYQLVLPDTNFACIYVYAPGYMYVSETVYLTEEQRYTETRRNYALEPVELNAKINLQNITFRSNSTELTRSAIPECDRLVRFLKDNPKIHIQLGGHTDNTGVVARKEQFSLERAESVKRYLVNQGIKSERITCKGFGMSQPIADNDTPEGRARNRRVEILVTQVE